LLGGYPLRPPISISRKFRLRQLKNRRNALLSHRLSFPTYRHNTDLFFRVKYSRRIYNDVVFRPKTLTVLWLPIRVYKHWQLVNFCRDLRRVERRRQRLLVYAKN